MPVQCGIKATEGALYINNKMVMSTGDEQYVTNMAKLAYGTVLEISYGMGIGHRALHANPWVDKIYTVDQSPGVFAAYPLECECALCIGDYRDFLTPVDTIVFDALPLNQVDISELLDYTHNLLLLDHADGATICLSNPLALTGS